MSKNIRLIATGFNVAPLVEQIKRHPELWNEITIRKDHPDSPHRQIDDIWVRHNDLKNYDPANGRMAFVADQHESVWYPSYRKLTEIRQLVFKLMALVEGERLGGVFITRIPPGCECKPHIDGGWHVEHYDKYIIQLESSPKQAFHFDGESLVTNPGDVFFFDNRQTHWVTNDSEQDRMSLIVAIRSDRGG